MRRIDLDRIFHERAFENAQAQQSRQVSIKKRKLPPRDEDGWTTGACETGGGGVVGGSIPPVPSRAHPVDVDGSIACSVPLTYAYVHPIPFYHHVG